MLVVLGSACGHRVEPKDVLGMNDAKLYELGQQEMTNGNYENARAYLERLVRQHPDSPLATQAQLMLADSYFLQDTGSGYQQAEVEYKKFIAIYPTNPKVSHAALQAALCHVQRMRASDRDQVETLEAEKALLQFVHDYPGSPQVEQAREALSRVQGERAHHDLVVAELYLKFGVPRAAIPRLRVVVDKYPRSTVSEEAHAMLVKALLKVKEPKQAAAALEQLKERFPTSAYVPQLEQELVRSLPVKVSQADENQQGYFTGRGGSAAGGPRPAIAVESAAAC
jgi:outer membrane protein assembly factor BamD